MIVTKQQMQQLEQASGLSSYELMEKVGERLFHELLSDTKETDSILILVGKGNNGGDGLCLARHLQAHRKVAVFLVDGLPTTKEAKKEMEQLDDSIFLKHLNAQTLKDYDIIIDAVYGFSYHGSLRNHVRPLFQLIQKENKTVYAIDINSGAEADSGFYDEDALSSKITYCLGAYKIFHQLAKHHQLFETCKLIDLDLPESTTSIHTMDEDLFFKYLPKKQVDDYKGSHGKAVLCGGCYGMAGALGLNILGALTIGSSYLQVCLEDSIYPILATRFLQPVFHPFSYQSYRTVLEPVFQHAKSIGFGSGAVYMGHKQDIFDMVIQNANGPIVFDAEALRLLVHNTYVLRFAKTPVILTPHIKEFADLANLTVAQVQDRPVEAVVNFVKQHHVNVVLKGPNTIAAFTSGNLYINQSGNQSLATAGSGDVLTGILTTLLSLVDDVEMAVCMGIYIHGHLADESLKTHSMQNFSFETYPDLMNAIYLKHQY